MALADSPTAPKKSHATPDFLSGGGDMGARMRSHPWSNTPLGAVEDWPQSLRTSVSTCLNCAFPILLWWGRELVMLYNDEYRPILGSRKHPAALGAPGRQVWPEIWSVIGPMLQQVMEKGEAARARDLLLLMDRNGYIEESYFSFSYSPIRDESGGVGGVFTPVIETTAKVVGERRMRTLAGLGARARPLSAEEACRTATEVLAENPHDVPFALLYYVEEKNNRACRLATSGVDSGDKAAPSMIALDSKDSPWPLAEVLRNGQAIVVEDIGRKFDRVPTGAWADDLPRTALVLPITAGGREQPTAILVAGANPRRALDGEHRAFFDLVATQISKTLSEALAYEEERGRAEALAEIDRAKTLFFSNVSHEFRTPLTLILGPLEDALGDPDSSPEERERIELAHRNSLRLLKLVNSLLDFSRIEAGRAEAAFEPVDLSANTAELASNFRSLCERAGLKLIVDCPPLPEPVYVDRDMWEKVVLNLVSNAFKFTMDGEIAVRLRAAGDHVELSICDTGVGIPEAELPRLFERFHRIEGQASRTYEGSGIGLALVQELVRLHGGEVHAESGIDRGTTFTISIPLGTAHLPAERIGTKPALTSTSVRAQAYVEEALRWLPDAAPFSRDQRQVGSQAGYLSLQGRPRVLLADDNADMREYVYRLLEKECEVQPVENGQAALDAIRAQRPDLVLTDVMMPVLDGFGLLHKIRADPELRDLPVILLSARAGEESRVEGLNAGADDYLVKPFSARELVAHVAANLNLARLRREATTALRTSEWRFRNLVSASSDVVYRMSADWSEMHQLQGRDFIDDTTEPSRAWLGKYIHPDDQPRVMDAIREAIRNKDVFELEHRVIQTDGTLGWTFSRAVPLTDSEGEITEWIGVASDITARKREQEIRELLIGELNHRVKNTLAIVQSIAMQTLSTTDDLQQARQALNSRLVALARAHDVLVREHWEGADLRELVAGCLAAYKNDARPTRVCFDGPAIRVQPKTALALSMALHELVTNAVKYGALSNASGRINVQWTTDPERDRFELRWCETGGPPVAAPTRRGFGSRLIERGLSQDLGGDVHLEFRSTGVVCTVHASLKEVDAAYLREEQVH
jgi:signal transduction histidine kinase